MKSEKMTIEEKKEALLNKIHESVPALEFISDLELCTMEDYEEIVNEAETNIREANDKTISNWYSEWIDYSTSD